MKFNDTHIHHHSRGGSLSAKSLLRDMDRLGLEKIALISWYGRDLREQKARIEETARIVRECPERLHGLAWIEPRHGTPLSLLDWVMEKKGYRGFKMIPNRWHPCEERILRYCERMARLAAPCLFHAGILYFETFSSRYCRPVDYEELLRVRNFRFALAHIGWPWTDECLALLGESISMRDQGFSSAEMFIDLAPGTPPGYREEALRRLIAFGAADFLLFGSDAYAERMEDASRVIRLDGALYRKLGLSRGTIGKIARGNFERFFARKRSGGTIS